MPPRWPACSTTELSTRFTGGEPPSLPDLERRFEAQAAGRSPDGTETWRNWIVRLLDDGAAVGFVEATLTDDDRAADVAWVIGVRWQRQGYAGEAARAMVTHLFAGGVGTVTAHVHPDHAASGRVAAATGLSPTDEIENGERVWRLDAGLRREGRRSGASSGGARPARRRG